MNPFEFTLILPEDFSSYLAILGELLCLQLYKLELQLGRIQRKGARDVLPRLSLARRIFLRRSAIPWLFIYLSRIDSQSCAQCTKAHLRVFPGRDLREAAALIRCDTTRGCGCVVIPIQGRWPMAQRLRAHLSSQSGSIELSEMNLYSLIHQGETYGEQDQLACRLLSAMLAEETNPSAARETYLQAISGIHHGSNELLQAAGYIRLADLLERSGDFTEAAHVTRSFLKSFTWQSVLAEPQHYAMKARKIRLLQCLLVPPSMAAAS